MTAQKLEAIAEQFTNTSPANTVPKEKALHPRYVGMRIFEAPAFGYAPADDDLFKSLKENTETRLNELILPREWMPGAKTVVSFYTMAAENARSMCHVNIKFPSETFVS